MGEFFKNAAAWCSKHSKHIATGATIAGAIAMAIGGIASAHNQTKLIDDVVTREVDRRLPPIKE